MTEKRPEEDLLEYAKRNAVEDVSKLDNPEDDILPVFLWMGPYGGGLMPCIPMRSNQDKARIAACMTASLVVARATECVFTSTSWMVEMERGPDETGPDVADPLAGMMPSEHPDRVEVITIMYFGKNHTALAQAKLTRHQDRLPDVGPWNQWSAEVIKVGGRFGEAVDRGLRMVEEMPEQMVEILDEAWAAGEQEQMITRFLKVAGQFVPGARTAGVSVQKIP
jgi:hypothetical protein